MSAGFAGFTIIPVSWDISNSATISDIVRLDGLRPLSLWVDADMQAGNLTFSAAIKLKRAVYETRPTGASPAAPVGLFTPFHNVEDDAGAVISLVVAADVQIIFGGTALDTLRGLQYAKFIMSAVQTTTDKVCYLVCANE